jgi:anaerobic dimethyl sulfoxide reductase subunit A
MIKEKLLSGISRRSFLKGMTAVGATAALYGCGGGSGNGKTYMEKDTSVSVPEITETKIVSGAAPHNCGGRCITRVYVKDGTITRIVTDETEDLNLVDGQGKDRPQMRACIRCRSNKQRFYRNDRILYPLKRKEGSKRGSGEFVKISWDQAISEISQKMKALLDKYGPESFLVHYASGDGNEATNSASCASRLMNLLGGQMIYRSDYSWPSLEHTSWFFFGLNLGTMQFYFPPGKSRQDAINSDVVILWSGNFAESIWGTNTAWYVQQFKEMGKEVIVIDSRISQTVVNHATTHLPVVPGTDAALAQAIIHELIVNTWKSDGTLQDKPMLDPEFILKYTHGFFDDVAYSKYPTIQKGYHSDVDRDTKYIVPNGASLSAYIMGTDDRLVKAGLNGATSIYPATIGYNSFDTEDPNDPLRTARVPMYGQVEKTPEWAEPICGIPAATIRDLATKFATKKITIWLGGGWQRQSEGEQGPLNVFSLAAITGQFGLPGRHFGVHSDRQPISFGLTFPTGDNPKMSLFFSKMYDFTKLSTPIDPKTYMPNYSPAITIFTFPVFLWPDIAKNGGTGKSMVNDGQVKRFPAKKMSCILNFAGNMLGNQCGNNNEVMKIVRDDTKVELIVTAEQFMTPSAYNSDYILPAATAFEKDGACTGWLAGDALTCMNKAVEPLGEALSDYNIVGKLADALGVGAQYRKGNKDNMTEEDWREQLVTPLLQAYGKGMTYAEWKEKGTLHLDETYGTHDDLANYRKDPAANPLVTPSGKFEIYCQAIVEDYEARGYDNIDRSGLTLEKGKLADGTTVQGLLKFAGNYNLDPNTYAIDWTSEKTTKNGINYGQMARYVYPIPMVIPMMEGCYADGTSFNPQKFDSKYKYSLNGWHIYYRSHSTHNNNAYTNQVFKKDAKGNPAFLNPNRPLGKVWDDNVYEPIWINPADAEKEGIVTGDRVIVESPRGSIYASAVVTNRIRPGWLGMGQGAWTNGDNLQPDGTINLNKPDIGGAINVLSKLRPARICQGMTLGADIRVSIRKG